MNKEESIRQIPIWQSSAASHGGVRVNPIWFVFGLIKGKK